MPKLPLEQLIDRENPAWEEIKELLSSGSHAYTLLPADRDAAAGTLSALQVSTRSYLGAIAYETGGIRLDHGWVTVLGAGHSEVSGSLASWNGLGTQTDLAAYPDLLVVAYDAAGGFFALNTGRFGQDGYVYYFAPDTLEWESTELAYSGFVNWLAHGDLDLFYQTFRWAGWQEDTEKLETGEVWGYYPPLWTAEGGGELSSHAPISVLEAWNQTSGQSRPQE
ncbi:DUF2625 family protein [Paenibacillus sp. JX-17]|uniref:DUF2625 family protein n=1 Tax=Paenibacillus lacisoli TaxID=3064525 RepID=A0ABT9CER6_9BACL|nr:DUF2625 family protein [Paenibacillus sp. JX-17]MDO7907761.1 DUF2625 family protein [Paenibacillus sp. JX-17]